MRATKIPKSFFDSSVTSAMTSVFYDAVTNLHTEQNVDGFVLVGAEVGLGLNQRTQTRFFNEALDPRMESYKRKLIQFYDLTQIHINEIIKFCLSDTTEHLA